MNNRGEERRSTERRMITDRRQDNIPVEIDRRSGGDRRSDTERRSNLDRRQSQ